MQSPAVSNRPQPILNPICFPETIKANLKKELTKQTVILVAAIIALVIIAALAITLTQIFFPAGLAITTTLVGIAVPFIFGAFFTKPHSKRIALMQQINLENRVIEKIEASDIEGATTNPKTDDEARIVLQARLDVNTEDLNVLKRGIKKEKTDEDQAPQPTTEPIIPISIQEKINQLWLEGTYFKYLLMMPQEATTKEEFVDISYKNLSLDERMEVIGNKRPYVKTYAFKIGEGTPGQTELTWGEMVKLSQRNIQLLQYQ